MSSNPTPPLLVISGPTASGKSALSLALAAELNGEIINSDSVQVYKGAVVGAARVTDEELALVPHHLLGHVGPDQDYNVSRYVREADTAIAEIAARGKRPLLVGGSTLYIKSLLRGLAALPEGSSGVRKEVETWTVERRWEALQQADPEAAARLHPNDTTRVTRALEVVLTTGTTISELHRNQTVENRYQSLVLVVLWPRDVLYERINQRTDAMVESGLEEEVRTLMKEYDPESVLMKTLGYRETLDYLEGRTDKGGWIEAIRQSTRRYAKRQFTFWRNEPLKSSWGLQLPIEGREVVRGAEPHRTHAVRQQRQLRGVACQQLSLSELIDVIKSFNTDVYSCFPQVLFLDGVALFESM